MKKEYLMIGIMALFYGGIIFSFIFLVLLREKKEKQRAKFKLQRNHSMLDEIDRFLKYGGYWLTLESWFGVQFLFLLTACFVGLNSSGILNALKNASGTFIMMEIILYMGGKYEVRRRNDHLNLDLCRLQETLFFQSDTGADKESVLLAVYEELKDPAFKKAIKDIVFAYSLKQDVIERIENLKDISNNMNLIVFSNTLIQDFQIGEAEENIEAQAVVMRRLISNRAVIERKSSMFKMMVIGVLLLVIYVFLTVTPILIEFTQNMNRVLG